MSVAEFENGEKNFLNLFFHYVSASPRDKKSIAHPETLLLSAVFQFCGNLRLICRQMGLIFHFCIKICTEKGIKFEAEHVVMNYEN